MWVAIGRRDRCPAFKGVPTSIVRYSPASLAEGIERHSIEGVELRVFNIAKTIADCFKFRNKIGIDVAL
jgi:predicted transcriptional regulator of viral defense system